MSTPVARAVIASASPHTAATTSTAPAFDNANFVFNINIFLLAIVCAFFLLSLPRAVIRFSHSSEWFDGQLLRYTTVKLRRPLRPDAKLVSPESAYLSPTSTDWLNDSEKYMDGAGYSAASHAVLKRSGSSSSQAHLIRSYSTASGRARRAHLDLPKHMPNWTTMLPQLSWITRISLRPGLTVGGASILIAYFAVMLYAGFYKSNIFTDPLRTGYVAASQIPVVIILATKVNVLGMLLGAAYTRVSISAALVRIALN